MCQVCTHKAIPILGTIVYAVLGEEVARNRTIGPSGERYAVVQLGHAEFAGDSRVHRMLTGTAAGKERTIDIEEASKWHFYIFDFSSYYVYPHLNLRLTRTKCTKSNVHASNPSPRGPSPHAFMVIIRAWGEGNLVRGWRVHVQFEP